MRERERERELWLHERGRAISMREKPTHERELSMRERAKHETES